MSDLLNSGVLNLISLALSIVLMLVGLVLWFFVNRASSRTNQQIELLQALLNQQKRQCALLRRLCEASETSDKNSAEDGEHDGDKDDTDLMRFVAER